MGFIRTNRNIGAAASTGYTAEQLFGVVIDLIRDVYDEAGVKKASALPVRDKKKLLTAMHSLSKVLVDVYAQNRDGLSDFVDEEFRDEVEQRAELIGAREADLAGIAGEIAEEEEKQRHLDDLFADISARRGHLLQVKESCDELQRQIDRLNDPALDTMADRNAALAAELAQRQTRADGLAAQLSSLENRLAAQEVRLSGLHADIEDLRMRNDALTAEETEAMAGKEDLEESITALQARVEEARNRLGDLPALSERLNEEYQELQMQLTVINNAVNSARDDAFLAGNLFAHSGGISLAPGAEPDRVIAGKKFSNWDEMETWLAELEGRINDLLAVYGDSLNALVKAAESITARQDEQ